MRLFLKIIGGIFLAFVLAIGGLALTLRANPPQTTFDVQARAVGDESSYLIFGATRQSSSLEKTMSW